MSARRVQGADHFDLLPFIAILMCTLGCLLFVTLAIASLSLGPSRGEGWVFGGAGSDRQSKIPILVEWDGTTATIHRDGRKVRSEWKTEEYQGWRISTDDPLNPELEEFLNWLAQHKRDHYALVAARPTGFSSLFIFCNLFRKRDIDVGYEPIEQNRAVALIPGK